MLLPTNQHWYDAKNYFNSKEMTTEKNFDLQERIKSTENSNKYLDFVLNPKYVTKLFFFFQSFLTTVWRTGCRKVGCMKKMEVGKAFRKLLLSFWKKMYLGL